MADGHQDLTPEVSMGVTECGHSDQRPGTIISVSPSRKSFTYQHDETLRTDQNGMSEQQNYVFVSNEEGPIRTARKNKREEFRLPGGGSRVLVGIRRKYHDFSF